MLSLYTSSILSLLPHDYLIDIALLTFFFFFFAYSFSFQMDFSLKIYVHL